MERWVIWIPKPLGQLRLDSRLRVWSTPSFRDARSAAFHVDGVPLRWSEWNAHEPEVRAGTWQPPLRYPMTQARTDSGAFIVTVFAEDVVHAAGATVDAAAADARIKLALLVGEEKARAAELVLDDGNDSRK